MHKNEVQRIAEWIVGSERVVVFAGAGMSTESGIPDFRSPGGLWEKYNPEDFYFQKFLSGKKARELYWQMATEMYAFMRDARPNAGHLAVAELESMGRLDCLITQNVDGLHFKAGHAREKVIELHGTAMHVACLSCQKRYNRDEIQARRAAGQSDPVCDDCGGLLKPATISFGQSMPEREMAEAHRRSSICSLFIVLGSSLVVHPAAQLPVIAKQGGAKLAIINRDETSCDDIADAIIRGPIGPTMAAILTEVKKSAGASG